MDQLQQTVFYWINCQILETEVSEAHPEMSFIKRLFRGLFCTVFLVHMLFFFFFP